MARKKDDDPTPETLAAKAKVKKKVVAKADPTAAKRKVKATEADEAARAEAERRRAEQVNREVEKRKAEHNRAKAERAAARAKAEQARLSTATDAETEETTPAAVLVAELEVLKAVLTSQQTELENRRSLLEQVEWRERLLAEELELLRGSQQDVAEARRETADARSQAADAVAQMAEALSQMAAAKAHAEDSERRLQEMLRESQETEQTLSGYQDELAELHHELEQSQEWQNDLESELSLREALLAEHRDELRELHRDAETLRNDNGRLEVENSRLEAENSHLQVEVSRYEVDVHRYESESQRLEDDASRHEGEARRLQGEVVRVEDELTRRTDALQTLLREHSEALLRLNELDDLNTELDRKLRIKDLAHRKLEKTLADRAEELAELANLVEEADAREDKLRDEHLREVKKLRAEVEAKPKFDEAGLEKVREQLQTMAAQVTETTERAERYEKALGAANALLDEVEQLLEKGQGLERLRVRLKVLRGGSKVLDELREKEFLAERRAEEAHQEMVSMRTRMLDAINQLEASEIARKRAEQKVAQLEEQLRPSR